MATKKTASKSKQSNEQSNQGTATPLRNRVIGLQLRSLEIQESAFDRTYDAVNSFQERAEDRLSGWLKESDRVPAEAKKLAEEWIGFNQKTRAGYKSAVDSSFGLGQKWFEGMKKTA